MNAMLVVKTANGYAVMPYTNDIPQVSMAELHVATTIGNHYGRGKCVEEILQAHFEPKVELEKVA